MQRSIWRSGTVQNGQQATISLPQAQPIPHFSLSAKAIAA